MLRQGLKIFLKTLSTSPDVQNALQKIDENKFHKRLRNEIIMLPIPKTKFNARKVPTGMNPSDFENEIIEKQTHVLQCAISRVSFFKLKLLFFANFEANYLKGLMRPYLRLLRQV